MSETLVAGIDSSTQSVKVLLVRAEDGVVVDQASAPHPGGTEVHPAAWWAALQEAGRGLLDRAAAIGVGGQQHGMVALDADGEVVRPALLWNDLRSAPQIDTVVEHLGGPQACADTIGSVPPASFTVTKLRWMAEHEPENAARTASVALPHDWLTWKLAGGTEAGADLITDHGEASGTGYYSPAQRAWLPEVAAWALGRDTAPVLPRLVDPGAVALRTPSGQVLSAGTGDNMAAALGLAIADGDVVVSIGTSGTAFCVADAPTAEPTGSVSGFCDATGRYLPLVCTVNASRVLAVVGTLLGVDHDEFARLALAGEPGAGGLTLLPYLDGERTPNRPDATGVLRGLTSGVTRENFARAAVESLLCSLADAVDALDVKPNRVLMIGGGSRNAAVQQLAPSVFGQQVQVLEPGEYVALGAARQAAWALSGAATPPLWAPAPSVAFEGEPQPRVREQYDALRDATVGW
ncbi:xylulokinase [Nakamurella sp. YIM 132087]|uniref:Xylulose kinase n=1 Tax=Nakamurella alba TaxID=2665158 RepID=A0A7K1FR28_9ACTN|nr:xylulokinase [Nakamurella alba]MTD15819.1 xylulokinase [Nakamurella alba]